MPSLLLPLQYGNASSVAVVTLAPPGTRGSISFGQKATIACERPQVRQASPLFIIALVQ